MLTPTTSDLNQKNYYDRSTDWDYQSPTFFKKFLKCEAETMAELNGEYSDMNHEALLVGNYLHSYFESDTAHENFIEENKSDILTRTGKPRAPFEKAEDMIYTLESDSLFQGLYQGDKEVIVEGYINGVKWKGKLDCLNLKRGYFLDLKTTRDIHKKFWNNDDREWESFVSAYNYQLQMYVYQELVRQTFGVDTTPYIVAVSKEKVPDKMVISIPDYRLEEAEMQIDKYQDHIEDVKAGRIEPTRCGMCDYCRSTAKLGKIVSMDELIS